MPLRKGFGYLHIAEENLLCLGINDLTSSDNIRVDAARMRYYKSRVLVLI